MVDIWRNPWSVDVVAKASDAKHVFEIGFQSCSATDCTVEQDLSQRSQVSQQLASFYVLLFNPVTFLHYRVDHYRYGAQTIPFHFGFVVDWNPIRGCGLSGLPNFRGMLQQY